MPFKIVGIKLTTWSGVEYGIAAQNPRTAKTEEALVIWARSPAEHLPKCVSKLLISSGEHQQAAEVVAKEAFVTIGLPFKSGDVHSLIHQFAKTTPGKIRLPGQEPEKACNCAVARQW